MANHASHAALPFPIKNARYTILVPYLDADGDPTDPTTPDTEISKDDAAAADTAEEVSSPKNSIGMLTLSGAELDCSCAGIAGKAASGPKTTLATLYPRQLPIASSGTLSAGSAGGGTLGTILAYDVTGCFLRTTGGTGGGGTGGANNQARRIMSYTKSTGAFTVVPNWETTPDNTTTYDVLLPEGITLGMIKALNPATAGRELVVDASGLADANTVKVGPTGSGTAQTAGDIPALINTVDDFLDTEIAAIKAKTDNLPSDPADASDIAALFSASPTASDVAAAVRTNLAVELAALSIRSSTAQAGAAGTITLDASASATDDFYNDTRIVIKGGTGAGQARRIRDYVGSTKVATIVPNWTTNPDNTSVFVVIPETSVYDETLADHLDSGSTGAALNAAGSAGDPWGTALPGAYGAGTAGKIIGDNVNATVSSRASQTSLDTVDDFLDTEVAAIKAKTDNLPSDPADASDIAATLATIAGYIDTEVAALLAALVIRSATAQAGAAGTITLDASASASDDFYNDDIVVIKSGTGSGQTRHIRDYVGATKVATVVPVWATNPDNTSVFAILPAVSAWDHTLTDHLDSGSAGSSLNAAGSAGDPWTTALPGAYGAGSAGKILGDNLNATVSSRASQTSLDTVDDFLDTEVAAIKAKTDNLPSDPADASDIAASFSTVNGTLATLATYVDTEVAAIKAKTDNLPSDPADASDVAAAIASLASTLTTIASYIDTEVAAIKAKTDNLPASPAATGSIPSAAAIATQVRTELTTELGRIDATTSSRATPAQVATEVSDALTVDTHGEPTEPPAFPATVVDMMAWVNALALNKTDLNKDTGEGRLRNAADDADIAVRTDTDDGTTYTKGAWETGAP